jgi:hypothetical protein
VGPRRLAVCPPRSPLGRAEGRLPIGTPPPAPALSTAQGDRLVKVVVQRSGASCLEEVLIRQAWLASRGERRDIVVGVTSPGVGFKAHAWLEGDPVAPGYPELFHKPFDRGVESVRE